ncbi:MAG TPA: SDR family oxidoreductase [Candidatus Binatia bacterium]|nr:SDR family oxidoreductase [Candidatus Binatia bacterium]
MRLAGKVALVTGATKGIGRGVARVFAREGAKVVLAGRTVASGEEAAREIRDDGGHAVFVATDIGREDDVARAVRAAVERFGGLTTLVNNAAATHLVGVPGRGDGRVGEIANAVLEETIRTNLWGLVWCCRHAIPEMLRAGGGSIVNISSGVATKGAPAMDAYTATKGAMNALTRSMAVEYAKQRIRVNAISTGLVESGEGTDELLRDPERRRWLEQTIPLPYWGVPDDIAWGCVYLASDEARYVTGAILPIDGGYLACPT